MPITTVKSDPAALTLTVVGDYPVPVERLWDAWSDPRQLEKFWGPETWPATFTRHDMAEGGESHYYMTGPDGAKSSGWWHFLKVVPGRSFEIEDGFSREDGSRNTDMPSMTMVFTFEGTAKGSRFTSVTRFPSVEAMEELVKMGMMEGLKSAMGQMDGVLADLASFAASRATEAQILSDTQVRITRVIRGTPIGDPVNPATFTRWTKQQATEAGVPPLTPHDAARHGWATLALTAGVPPKVVQERLGHSSISITMDRYSHVIEGMDRAAAEAVAALIEQSSG
jgi:uncharacterized protein YndB with AHSA1/START domain